MTTTSLLPDVGIELREGYADVGDATLHYVEAGDGLLVVLLHGFPEFWFGWRLQIEPLAAAGFRVVAPTRAATTSRRSQRATRPTPSTCSPPTSAASSENSVRSPRGWRSRLGRIHRMDHRDEPPRGRRPARHPQRRASPEALRGTTPPEPASEVLVLLLLRGTGTAQDVVHARDWHFFRHFLSEANPPYTPDEIERYVEAWSQPGAAAGMINYYRASVRRPRKKAARSTIRRPAPARPRVHTQRSWR